MKILMLNYEYPPLGGGAARAHQQLIRHYADCEHLQVDVLTASDTPADRLETPAANIRLHRIGLNKKNRHYWRKIEILEWLFKARCRYDRLTRENHYDLVHAFSAFPSAYPCLRTAGRMPYVISLRGSDVPGFNTRLKGDYVLLSGLFRRVWKNAAAVVANSEGLAELAQRFEPSIQYGVIPNGVDTDFFSPPPSRRLSEPIKLLAVGRLIARKRIDLLIQTLGELVKNDINAELHIAGAGNLQAPLYAQAQTLGVADRVRFHGLLEANALAALYQSSDLFLMSSLHEGMSNAMLEAMASGLPIVTTACEGTGELIGDNGIIVPPQPRAFCQAVIDLLNDPDAYRLKTDAARQKALGFNWADKAQRYLALYRTVLQNSPLP